MVVTTDEDKKSVEVCEAQQIVKKVKLNRIYLSFLGHMFKTFVLP